MRRSVKVICLSLLWFYTLVPFEGGGDRFPLVFRIVCMMLLLIYYFSKAGNLHYRHTVVVTCLISFFISFLLLANLDDISLRFVNTLATMLLVLFVYLFINRSSQRHELAQVINWILLASAGAIFLQYLSFYIFGTIIELHGVMFPWEESRTVFLERFGFARFAGLYTEPGTHANWVVAFILLKGLLTGKVIDRVSIVAMISVALAITAWGILAVITFILSLVLFLATSKKMIGKNIFLFSMSAGLIAGLAIYLDILDAIFDYFSFRAELQNESGMSKTEAWKYGWELLGDFIFIGFPIGYDYCRGCQSPQDAGIILNLGIYFGAFAAALFAFLYIFGVTKGIGVYAVPLGVILLFGKYYYFDPIVWLIFLFAVSKILQKRLI